MWRGKVEYIRWNIRHQDVPDGHDSASTQHLSTELIDDKHKQTDHHRWPNHWPTQTLAGSDVISPGASEGIPRTDLDHDEGADNSHTKPKKNSFIKVQIKVLGLSKSP